MTGGPSDGAYEVLNTMLHDMLHSPGAQATFNMDTPMATLIDTFDLALPPDSDENFTCDLCDQVHREGLDRIVTAFEPGDPPTDGSPGYVKMIAAAGKSPTDLAMEKLDRPRVILVLYSCRNCSLEIQQGMDRQETF
jgi:hypothetical protein